MEVIIQRPGAVEDSDGNWVDGTQSFTYDVSLEDGTLKATFVVNHGPDLEGNDTLETVTYLNQPFKPTSTGEKEEWDTLENGVEWFKQQEGHIGA